MTTLQLFLIAFAIGSFWTFAGCFILAKLADVWPEFNSLMGSRVMLSVAMIVLWPIPTMAYGLNIYFESGQKDIV